MKLKIPLISDLYNYYKIFYSHTGYRLFVLFSIILFSGIFDGLGISIAIPLLDYQSGVGANNKYSQIVYDFLNGIGLGVSLTSILLLLVTLFLLKGTFTIFQSIVSSQIRINLIKDLKKKFCAKYAGVKYEYFVNKPLGFFNNILTTEINNAVSGLNNYIKVVICIINISVYILAAFLINYALTIFVLVLSIIVFFSLRILNRHIQNMSFLISETNADIQSLVIQTLYNFKYLKATSSFKPVLNKTFVKLEENKKYQFRISVFNAAPPSFVEIFSIVILSGLVWYYVGIQNKQIGEILVLLYFFWRALNKVLNFQNWWQRFCAFVGAINVVNDTYRELDVNTEKRGGVKVRELKKGIELTNVDFSYGSKKVLNSINMIIPKGKIIGIVGRSGAGKTTLFDLIAGLLIPQSGSIKIDGLDYRDIDMVDLRLTIGYVTQEPVTFNDTIFNNITFWNYESGDTERMAEIKNATDLAQGTSFINECEKGLDTVIGDRGVKLSGGQRQRIAIAREIYKNPQIMIFDEATSALDTESEDLIHRSINAMRRKYTMVIIAHRLSTIRDCDIIYTLEEGRVVESGTFDELYAKDGGAFKKMCEAQNIL